jgi:hypothetical protein
MEPKHHINFDELDDMGLRGYADGVIADLALGYTPHEVARRRNLALAIDGDRVAVVLPGWVARIGYDAAYYRTQNSWEAAHLHAAGGPHPAEVTVWRVAVGLDPDDDFPYAFETDHHTIMVR